MKLLRLLWAAALATAVAPAAIAAELGNGSVFSQTDASNASGTLPTWAEGMAPSQVNDSARALQGALKRDRDHRGPTVTSAGTDTITLTYSVAPAAYYTGDVYCFIAGGTNTGAATVNVNGLGAKSLKKGAAGGTALAAGDVTTGGVYCLQYDGTNMQVLNPGTALGTVTSVGITAPAAGIGVSGSPVTGSGSITLSLANDLSALEGLASTGLAARTGSDAWAQRTITAGSGIVVSNGSGASGDPTITTDRVGVTEWGGTSAGSANAQTITLSPVPGAYSTGMRVIWIAGFTNTAATTLNANSLGAKNVFLANAALAGGEILSGKVYEAVYDGTQFQLVSPQGTQHGALIGLQKFTSSGTSTYTPTAGTNSVYVLCVGAGGGGGGAATTGAGQAAAGGGGGGGGTAAKRITSSFSGVTVTVGAKGTGGTAGANAGNAGGDSSFGALVVAKGGSGGTAGTLTGSFPGTNAWVGGGASSGATGDVLADGGNGQGAYYFSSATVTSGSGGSGANGSAGARPAVGNPGAAAGNNASTAAPGGGGAGAVVTASLTQQAGGNGSDGACYAWEFN